MVRQAYVTRQALGRSAFELPQWQDEERLRGLEALQEHSLQGSQRPADPVDSADYVQNYNTRGHPENLVSRTAARRSRRAQNDILSTVGVCVSVDQNGKIMPATSTDSVRKTVEARRGASVVLENEIGLWIGFTHDLFCLVSPTFIINLRQRCQTFRSYSATPLSIIAMTEWNGLGPLAFFFAGEVASVTFVMLDAVLNTLLETLSGGLITYFASLEQTRVQRHRTKKLIKIAEGVLSFGILTTLLPLLFYGSLQRIGLLPARPFILNPFKSKSLWRYFMPPRPTQWTIRSSIGYIVALGQSPPVLYECISLLRALGDTKLPIYAKLSLPRPGHPDYYSVQGSTDDDGSANEHAQLAKKSEKPNSLFHEVKRDFQGMLQSLESVRASLSTLRTTMANIFNPHNSHNSRNSIETITRSPITPTFPPIPSVLLPSNPTTTDSSPPTDLTPLIPPLPPSGPSASSTATPSPRASFSSSDAHTTLGLTNPNVQITTRTGSTDTLHMQVEVNPSVQGGLIFSSSFSASPRPTTVETVLTQTENEPRYHVTALSLYPTDSLSAHLTTAVIALIRLPLETLYLRSLALAFLAPAGLDAANSIYPMSTWFGLGLRTAGWRRAGDYACKIALLSVADAVMGLVVWQVGVSGGWAVGRRWFGWGRL